MNKDTLKDILIDQAFVSPNEYVSMEINIIDRYYGEVERYAHGHIWYVHGQFQIDISVCEVLPVTKASYYYPAEFIEHEYNTFVDCDPSLDELELRMYNELGYNLDKVSCVNVTYLKY